MKHTHTTIPKKMREDMSADPEYTRCALQGLLMELIGPCGGRVTREHAMKFAGRKVQERWAIPPICAAHHGVDQYQDAPTEAKKEIRVWVALNRAQEWELKQISKVTDYVRERDRLNVKYGVYVAPPIPASAIVPPVPQKAPLRRLSKEELFEREVRAYARTNKISPEEARVTLAGLV